MLASLKAWAQANKIVASLIVLLLLLLLLVSLPKSSQLDLSQSSPAVGTSIGREDAGFKVATDTITIQESNLSLVVSDVRRQADEVVAYAKRESGLFVSSSLTSPEESPLATVVVRVPSDKLQSSVEYFRTLAVKVTSENLMGVDITREFQDLDAQIKLLENSIKKLGEIRSQATETEDLVTITRELLSLQQQKDSYVSQKNFLEESANLSKITVYLSTDELALPYQPVEKFRPDVVFKLAVRDLIGGIQNAGEALIKIGVYSVVWIPLLAAGWYLGRRFKIF